MTETELFNRLGVSVAIGLLVGLQRGWQSRAADEHSRAAGFRTFALSGLLGGIAGGLTQSPGAQSPGALVIGLVFLGYTAAFSAFQWLEARTEGDLSVTNVVAGMITFLLGSLAVVGELRVAIAGAVVTTVLLALREPMHRWVASLSWVEIRAVLILLVMTFLMLPLLPDRAIDPMGVINPHEIWVLTILVAGVSFAGYVAVRAFGARLGVLVTAAAGGLASSTATTLVFARLARQEAGSARLLSAGVLASGTVMLLRVLAIAVALNPALWPELAAPVLTSAGILGGGAFYLAAGLRGQPAPDLHVANPLVLGTALKLAALIVAVMTISEAARLAFGNAGLILVAGLSGLGDVDAVTISMAQSDLTAIPVPVAGRAILVAVMVNTMSKTVIAAWIGGSGIGFRTGIASVLAVIGGVAAYLIAGGAGA